MIRRHWQWSPRDFRVSVGWLSRPANTPNNEQHDQLPSPYRAWRRRTMESENNLLWAFAKSSLSSCLWKNTWVACLCWGWGWNIPNEVVLLSSCIITNECVYRWIDDADGRRLAFSDTEQSRSEGNNDTLVLSSSSQRWNDNWACHSSLVLIYLSFHWPDEYKDAAHSLSLLFNYHYYVLHLMVEQFARWKRRWPSKCDQAKITLVMFSTSTQWGQIKRSSSVGNRTRARSDKWDKLRIGKFGRWSSEEKNVREYLSILFLPHCSSSGWESGVSHVRFYWWK